MVNKGVKPFILICRLLSRFACMAGMVLSAVLRGSYREFVGGYDISFSNTNYGNVKKMSLK